MASSSFDASQVDALHSEGKFDQVWTLLTESYDTNEDNVEVIWRYARACFDRQEASDSPKEKEEYVRKGLTLADRSLKLDDTHYALHKWRGILLSELGNYMSLKEKIQNSFLIKEEFEKALEVEPEDVTTLYGLGRWCQSVAGIGWMQRKLAATLFETPPQATFEEAIAFYKKAWDVNPPHKRAAYAMGECYYALKNIEKCREWMKKCIEAPTPSQVEKQLDEKAKKYLK